MSSCRICRREGEHRRVKAREMMFGFGDEFDYLECSACGCVQIERIPPDLSRYYPAAYYSFSDAAGARPMHPARMWLRRRRNAALVKGRDPVGAWLARRFPEPNLACLGFLHLRETDRILDVGCGAGNLLRALHDIGFRDLHGIDAFIPSEGHDRPGLTIRKGSLGDLAGTYDVILFHHSFEHVPDPAETLVAARDRLTPNGVCLLRIPTVSSLAWRHYGTDWVQFDAPRHLHLFSREGIARLADRVGMAGLEIRDVSTAFQFWGSEQYRKGIPLESERSFAKHPERAPFTKQDIHAFERRAQELNRAGEGDEIAVLLRKTDEEASSRARLVPRSVSG